MEAERLVEHHGLNHVNGQQRDRADALDRLPLRPHTGQPARKRLAQAPASPPALAARVTPAMASGLTDHVWTLEAVVGLLDQTPAITRERGSSPQPHSGRVSTIREPL